MRPDLIGSTCAARLTYLGLSMRDRQEPGAQGCIKECGEEARDKGTRGTQGTQGTLLCCPVRLLGTIVLFSHYLLPYCLTDAGTAEYVRQGAAAQ